MDRPWGFQKNYISRFQDNGYTKVVRLSALCTGRLYPRRKYSWYSFLLETESNPRPQFGPEVHVSKKFQWRHPTRNLPTFSALLQKIEPPRTPFRYTLTPQPLEDWKKWNYFLYPFFPNFRKSTAFWKVPRLFSCVLITATCRWRWVRSIARMIVTVETEVLGENTVPVSRFPPLISHGPIRNQDRLSAGTD